MEKILIFLKIPSVGEEYEIYVPDHVSVKELVSLLSEAVSELTRHLYVPSGSEVRKRRSSCNDVNNYVKGHCS